MKYIECPKVRNTQHCMSTWCLCSSSEIRKGEGYIYISPKVVSFRKNACSLRAFQQKLDKRANSNRNLRHIEYEPILICKKAAELYHLDLSISSDDAKIWWAKHRVPLRVTPKVLENKKKEKFRFFTIMKQNNSQKFTPKLSTGTTDRKSNYTYNNIINDNKNHSDSLSINKKFRLSKEQMNTLSSADCTSQVTGMHLEELANNIIDENNIRTFGRNFLIKNTSTPMYSMRYLSDSPKRDLLSFKYALSLLKWLLPIIFSIWVCSSMGMFF